MFLATNENKSSGDVEKSKRTAAKEATPVKSQSLITLCSCTSANPCVSSTYKSNQMSSRSSISQNCRPSSSAAGIPFHSAMRSNRMRSSIRTQSDSNTVNLSHHQQQHNRGRDSPSVQKQPCTLRLKNNLCLPQSAATSSAISSSTPSSDSAFFEHSNVKSRSTIGGFSKSGTGVSSSTSDIKERRFSSQSAKSKSQLIN